MTTGQTIRLIPKTKKGKDRIRRDGDLFIVLDAGNSVPCLEDIGMRIASKKNGNQRWIAATNDKDFEVQTT